MAEFNYQKLTQLIERCNRGARNSYGHELKLIPELKQEATPERLHRIRLEFISSSGRKSIIANNTGQTAIQCLHIARRMLNIPEDAGLSRQLTISGDLAVWQNDDETNPMKLIVTWYTSPENG